jgi:hypothetical protein
MLALGRRLPRNGMNSDGSSNFGTTHSSSATDTIGIMAGGLATRFTAHQEGVFNAHR